MDSESSQILLSSVVDCSGSDFQWEKPDGEKVKIAETELKQPPLQECEKDIQWFRENFIGKQHVNFLATESPNGPLAVSIAKTASDDYRLIVRSSTGSERITVSASSLSTPLYRRLFGLGPSYGTIMTAASSSIPVQSLQQCKHPDLPNELLAMEERQVIRSYKIGVLYVAPGQSTEMESFQNNWDQTSPAFRNFLELVGDKIELQGWKGYRAGLDVNEGQTGQHSFYTKWQTYEMMFHVAPLLPFSPAADKQQLERKRHIGNDIVVILFMDSAQDDDTKPFKLSTITSKQNHVFFIVRPSSQADGKFTFSVINKTGVPSYDPRLPPVETCIVDKNVPASRDFLLLKLLNAERACYKSPSFAPKISRTRKVLLEEVSKSFLV